MVQAFSAGKRLSAFMGIVLGGFVPVAVRPWSIASLPRTRDTGPWPRLSLAGLVILVVINGVSAAPGEEVRLSNGP